MKRMRLITVIGAIALASLATAFSYVGCGGGSSGSSADTTAPQPLTIGPAGNATNIALNAVITATFSEALNPDTVSSTTFTLYNMTADIDVAGTVTYSNLTATFTPTANLALAGYYRARITTGVKDLAGNALVANYQWYFYTRDGAWGTDGLIETNDTAPAYEPQVAMDPNGNAIAVWRHWDGSIENIYANRYVSGTGWAGPISITDNSGYAAFPQVAMDPAGNAMAVWYQGDGARNNIWANRYVSPTGWAGAVLIETDNTGDAIVPQVSVNSSGDAIAIWQQITNTKNSIWANHYISGTGWTGAELVETGDTEPAMNPQVTLDSSGNSVAVWIQSDGARYNIWGNRYVSPTGWATAGLIETDNTGDAIAPQIAVGPSGDKSIAVWQQITNTKISIWANRFVSGTGWAGATLIETSDTGDATSPQIAFDDQGFAIAIWEHTDAITPSLIGIYAAYFNTENNTWGAPQILETSLESDKPQIAFDQDQNATAIWLQSDGIRFNIYASRYLRSTNAWGTAGLVESGANDAIDPQIAFDASGNAIAVWLQSDGTRDNVRANRFVFE